MIIRRNKPTIVYQEQPQSEQENQEVKTKNIEVVKTFSKHYKYSLNNCKSREEEVLLAFKILEEEQGIDLYDPNNYPGMWLKTSQNKEEKQKSIFLRTEKIQNIQKAENSKEVNKNIPINLINFFKNGK
jgi:hypothetical protein